MGVYIKRNWRRIIWVCLLGVIGEGLYTVNQFIMMEQFDAAIQFDLRRFLLWTAVDVAFFGVYFLNSTVKNNLKARAVQRLNNQVRHDLYLTLLQKGQQDFHAEASGKYLSWLTTNVKQIEQLSWEPFFTCVNEIAAVVFCALGLLKLHWSMLLFGLVATAVMLSVPKLFNGKMERLGQLCAAAEAKGVDQIKELLAGFDVLRAFGRVRRFLRQGDQASDEIEQPNVRRKSSQALYSSVMMLFSVLFQILQLGLTVLLAFQGKIILGAMASASNLTAGITNGLSAIIDSRISMISARAYFANIAVQAGDGPAAQEAELQPLETEIAVENLHFAYGDKTVLDGLSLHFAKGGKYALTGPSGCGKSTVLKLLLGWLPDYQGAIRFDGRDARSFTPAQLQSQMSYIEQDVFLFNTTIRDNITLGEDFPETQLQKALRDSALDGDLVSMPQGLDTPVGENGSSLSGGQKQRVAIARALLHDRSILLVDEGTSALDQKNADIVEQSLLQNPDLTLILISHHLSPARKAQFTRVYDLTPVMV